MVAKERGVRKKKGGDGELLKGGAIKEKQGPHKGAV